MLYGIERRRSLMALTPDKLRAIREKVNEALKPVGEELGCRIQLGNCTYSDNEANFKMKVNPISDSGEIITKEYEDLLSLSKMRGFDVEKEYPLNAGKVKLVGYNTRARKWSFIVEKVENKERVRVSQEWFDRYVMTDSSCNSGSCGC